MRTISAAHAAILAGAPKFSTRFRVKDGTGAWRDLTTYGGVNLVETIVWREDVDGEGIEWEVMLKRELDQLSLAPLMEASPFNRLFSHLNAYSPLLAGGRAMLIEWALQAEDDLAAAVWNTAVSGWIDTVNAGGESRVQVTGRGEQAPLVKKYIERERLYAYAQGVNATKGVYIWPDANTGATYRTFAVGDLVVPTGAKANAHFYRCSAITTGIVATTEPVWPTGAGSTVVDGGVTWTESGATSTTAGTAIETVLQQLLTDNGTGVTLWCPVSPGQNVRWFQVDRQPLFGELRALADSFGWCIRPVYDSGTSAFRLKLYDPNRATVTSLRTFLSGQVRSVDKAAIDVMDIRNAGRGVYSDSQDRSAGGDAKRKAIEVSDSASITKFERQFCEIDEASTSNIDTAAEMTALLNAVLSDMKDPLTEFSAKVTLFPWVDLCDLYTLAADGVHFDSNQVVAVSGYECRSSAEDFSTSFNLRGTPSSGFKAWLRRMTDVDNRGETHALTALGSGGAFSLVLDGSTLTSIGGVRGVIESAPDKVHQRTEYEIHLSTSSSFTPSSSTLAALSTAREFETGALVPGQTYYMQVVPVLWNNSKPVRGSPSVETSFVAGFAEPGHLNPETVKGPTPPNGGFEGWGPLGGSAVPSHWSMVVGSWDREIARATASNSRTGSFGLNFTSDTTTAPKIRSAFFPALAGSLYALSAWVKKFGTSETGDNLVLAVEWYDSAKSLLSTSSLTTDLFTLSTNWTKLTQTWAAPASTMFAKVYVAKGAANNFTCYVDDISLEGGAEPVHIVNATNEPAYENSWVNYDAAVSFTGARFYKNELGEVVLEGLVKSGTIGGTIFTLPIGYRPPAAKEVYQVVVSNDAVGVCWVLASGIVRAQAGSNVHFSLWGIRFRPA